MKFHTAAVMLCSTSLAVSTAAMAQGATSDTAPVQNSATANAGIDEIIVTAQRRQETLLEVPLSIQAASGEKLASSGIQDLSQLQLAAPGVSSNAGFGYTQVFIRGVGNNIYVGADPSVATYIDQVPRTFGTLQSNLVNVERVEVLKGAQGGLYGRNATGGVVNIITRQPGDDLDLRARVLYGSKNTLKLSGYANVPLGDKAAWNLSVERDTHDFYANNVATPNRYTAANFPTGSYLGTPQQTADFFNSAITLPKGVGDQHFWSIDSKLRFDLTDDFRVTIAGDYSEKRDSSGAAVVNTTPELLQGTFNALLGAYGVSAVLQPGFVQPVTGKFNVAYSYGDPEVNLTDYGGSVTAVLGTSIGDLTSITSYREQESFYQAEGAYGNPPFIPEVVTIKKRAFYQELRLVGDDTGPLHYIVGGTYLATKFDSRTDIQYLPPFPFLPSTFAKTDVKNWSAYAELGYKFTDQLSLTVSGRYIHETNNTSFPGTTSVAKLTQSDFLPSATLSYRLGGGGNVYARWARGIKSGGVNPIVPPSAFPNTFGSLFAPEKVDTFELGFREAFLDNKLQLTGAFFYNDYKDLHAFTTGNLQNSSIIQAYINAGTARTYGVEGSINWRVVRPLTLSVNAGYLNAKYKSFRNDDGRVLNTFDYSGQRMIYSPELQVSFNANLDAPLNDRFSLTGNALASYTDKQVMALSSIQGIPDAIAPSYWLVNLRGGVKTSDGRYELAVFANNVFNEGYYVVSSHSALGNVFGWGEPRIVGVELRVKY